MLWKIVLSAVLLTLAYPKFNFGFLAWVAFVPFLFAINNKPAFTRLRLGFLFGLIFFGLTVWWLIYVSIPGYVLLILYLAFYFGLFGFLIKPTSHSLEPVASALFIPAIWILLEYARTHLLTGFGWVLLGYSQYLNLPLIQIADKTSVWGVSFIIMMVNVTIFIVLKKGIWKSIRCIILTVLVLAYSLYYGYAKLEENPPSRKLTVSLIQGNIPQDQKWDEAYKEEILSIYETLTIVAASDPTQLIIWPETALPGYLEEEGLRKRIAKLACEANTPLLIGAPSMDGYKKDVYYNSAVLISAEGKILKQHNKLHLVPFGEYVPFKENLTFIRKFINKPIGDFSPGEDYTIFRLKKGLEFGVLICFEDIFPDLVRDFVKKGARFMVNITNDAWFMDSGAPYQHAQASVFRAIENRIPIIRAANTGLSCFIDSRGRIIDRVSVNKKDIFVSGFKTSQINIRLK